MKYPGWESRFHYGRRQDVRGIDVNGQGTMRTAVLRWLTLAWAGVCLVPAGSFEDALTTLRAVDREGQGNEAASAAWRQVTQADAARLPEVLAGLDGANPIAANWLSLAVEALANRASKAGSGLPLTALGALLLDPQHSPRARHLAWELIARADLAIAESLVPGFLSDPAPELRREAVQRLLNSADRRSRDGQTNAAAVLYQQALGFAREADQVEQASGKLRDWGISVDLVRLFGWLRQWQAIGPFDNAQRAGFDIVFAPEQGVDLEAEVHGKTGLVRWKPLISTNAMGVVDLNPALGKLKDATAYCYTEVLSERAQPVELRLACKNAWKIWLNGTWLFGRDEYHRGMEIDQYRLSGQLRQGTNTILVKICQNEQVEEWTEEWQFQLRLCDAQGATLLLAQPFPQAATPVRRP
jgi:hypothetical protein